MEKIYSRPEALLDSNMAYCPGCLHGVLAKIIAEVIDEMGLRENTIAVLPIGCGALISSALDTDCLIALHGRAPAAATGLKRTAKEKFIFTYQGDGDLASIGLAEIMHAANRGENFAVLFVNNGIFGMTGGQMAPTTLIGQKATTAKTGRTPKEGYPMHMCEILSTLKAPVYIERCSMDSPQHILTAKKAIKKAFQNELDGKGFSFVELLSNCPTNWSMTPEQTLQYMREHTIKEFPLGVYRDETGKEV